MKRAFEIEPDVAISFLLGAYGIAVEDYRLRPEVHDLVCSTIAAFCERHPESAYLLGGLVIEEMISRPALKDLLVWMVDKAADADLALPVEP